MEINHNFFYGFLFLCVLLFIIFQFIKHVFFSPRKKIIKKLKNNLDRLVILLTQNYPHDERVQRLYQRYHNRTQMFESIYDETYTLNKGEAIAMCINDHSQSTGDGNIPIHNDLNLLTFVGIHEMAHIMSIVIDHKDEFWHNFAFLLENAVKWNLYMPIDYQHDPSNYCKMVIYDNPYFYDRTPKDFGDKIFKIIK